MSRMERDLARLAQGAALVVARLAELRPLSYSGESPTAATNAYSRWSNAQNNSFPGMSASAPRQPGEGSVGLHENEVMNSLKGTSFASTETHHAEEKEGSVPPSHPEQKDAMKAAEQFMVELPRHEMEMQNKLDPQPTGTLPSSSELSRTAQPVAVATAMNAPSPSPSGADLTGHAESTAKAGMAMSKRSSHRETDAETSAFIKQESTPEDPKSNNNRNNTNMASGFTKKSDPRKTSRVPAGQFERVARFAGLGLGMAMGTVGQLMREVGSGSVGKGGVKGLVLNEANSDRLTMALCRMRGAALKLGQLLSIQDEHVIPKDSPLRQVIDRVREEAEQMPPQQLYPTLEASLGRDWRSKFHDFDDEPMAAASIGQVHRAVTHDGMQVAVKIQYPGVADSIDSDIANLGTFVGPFAPRGLFLSTALEELRSSMKMETDYKLEAELTEKMRGLLADDAGLRVPRVQWELSSERVLATELLPGVPFDQVSEMSQEVRDHVARSMLRLTLRELFEFHLMQTDPNWSNFLYDAETGTLNLIDFGATMTYSHDMCYQYAHLVKAAVDKDRQTLLDVSLQMGFLTGEETPEFLAAHVGAAFITGEPFAAEEYDFGSCRMTERNSEYIATMLAGRLTPPPRFVYTLHRKLSGAFLSCMRLRARIRCRDIFLEHFNALEQRHQQILSSSTSSASINSDEAAQEQSPLSAAPV